MDRVLEPADHDEDDFLSNVEIRRGLGQKLPSLKAVVLKTIEADPHVPWLSTTLEPYEYLSPIDLPAQFMEAELDFFCAPMLDLAV